jgi:cyclic dehypoxanthinyl futalosine synthase
MDRIDRTSREFRDALDLYERASLLELGDLADRVRWRLHPDPVVTYIIDRNINYTNVCVADCGFCAFYRRPKDAEGYVLSFEEIGAKIEECRTSAGSDPDGGTNPYIPFDWYLELLRYIKANHPIPCVASPVGGGVFRGQFGWGCRVVRRLRAAGLDSILRRRRRIWWMRCAARTQKALMTTGWGAGGSAPPGPQDWSA